MYLRYIAIVIGSLFVSGFGCARNHSAAPDSGGEGEIVHAKFAKGSPEKARLVGVQLGRLKPGMLRKEVEDVIGEPDGKTVVRDYESHLDKNCYTVMYYAHLTPQPGDRFIEGDHVMSVMYKTADGEDRFVRFDGPHFPE